MHPRAAYDRIRFAEFEVDLGSGELLYQGESFRYRSSHFRCFGFCWNNPGNW
jgi:hypothetical protein